MSGQSLTKSQFLEHGDEVLGMTEIYDFGPLVGLALGSALILASLVLALSLAIGALKRRRARR